MNVINKQKLTRIFVLHLDPTVDKMFVNLKTIADNKMRISRFIRIYFNEKQQQQQWNHMNV